VKTVWRQSPISDLAAFENLLHDCPSPVLCLQALDAENLLQLAERSFLVAPAAQPPGLGFVVETLKKFDFPIRRTLFGEGIACYVAWRALLQAWEDGAAHRLELDGIIKDDSDTLECLWRWMIRSHGMARYSSVRVSDKSNMAKVEDRFAEFCEHSVTAFMKRSKLSVLTETLLARCRVARLVERRLQCQPQPLASVLLLALYCGAERHGRDAEQPRLVRAFYEASQKNSTAPKGELLKLDLWESVEATLPTVQELSMDLKEAFSAMVQLTLNVLREDDESHDNLKALLEDLKNRMSSSSGSQK
jgi:hypothetical protein